MSVEARSVSPTLPATDEYSIEQGRGSLWGVAPLYSRADGSGPMLIWSTPVSLEGIRDLDSGSHLELEWLYSGHTPLYVRQGLCSSIGLISIASAFKTAPTPPLVLF